MGAIAETVADPAGLGAAFLRAKAAAKTSAIVMEANPCEGWTTHGHAWEIGTACLSDTASVRDKHAEMEAGHDRQGQGV